MPLFQPSEKSPLFRAPSSMFWVGFLLRVLYITLAHTYRIRLGQDHLQFGWEMGRIARALVTGFGYADPFTGHTGPTAWTPPLYPLLIAGVFKIFGVYTAKSAWVLLTINSIFSAATSSVIYEIATRCFNGLGSVRAKKIALWSGWLWALHPAAMQYAVRWIWDMAMTTFLFSKLIVLALRVRGIGENRPAIETQTTSRWAFFGILSGLIGLLNSTLILFVPVCGLWMLLGAAKNKSTLPRALSKAIIAGALFFACLAPWMWRNWTVFHAFVPSRGNFGAELHASVAEGYNGFTLGSRIPVCEACPEYKEYKQLGELTYVHREGLLAQQYIQSHKLQFAELALKRFYFYWVSVPHPIEFGTWNEAFRVLNYSFLSLAALLGLALALKERIPGAVLFAWAFALLPLVYYFVTVQARFRHSLEPIMTILAVFLFQSATPRRTSPAATPHSV
jgi:Dolichyl-phosphate-mannose-protein mannosyltransferase